MNEYTLNNLQLAMNSTFFLRTSNITFVDVWL